jgi:hypothetical protein
MVEWRCRLQAPGIAPGYWTPDEPLVLLEVREWGVSEKQLNSGHAAAPVESVRRVPVSRTHRLFFIWNLAVGVSPPKDDAARSKPRLSPG